MESKKIPVKAALILLLASLLLSGCAYGPADDIPYSEASSQVLVRTPARSADSGYDAENGMEVGE